MKPNFKTIKIAVAILVVASAIFFIMFYFYHEPVLVLNDEDTGRVFTRFPLDDGASFSITFRHSVNKSDVTEIYQRRGKEIWLTGCIYYDFGAGVAEVLDPGWTLETGTNGEMIIGNIEMIMNDLTYIVGTVYDHILEINGEKIILNELCGKNAKVHFSIR